MYTPDLPSPLLTPDHGLKSEVSLEGNPPLAPDAITPIIENRLTEILNLLEEMQGLAEHSADDKTSDAERQKLQKELDRLRQQIDQIADGLNS